MTARQDDTIPNPDAETEIGTTPRKVWHTPVLTKFDIVGTTGKKSNPMSDGTRFWS